MHYTKTYTKNGFDLKAVVSGKAEDRVAEIYTNGEYCGKLYCVHGYRADRFVFWADKPFTTSEDGLFDAAKTLSGKYLRAKAGSV